MLIMKKLLGLRYTFSVYFALDVNMKINFIESGHPAEEFDLLCFYFQNS